MSTLTEEQSIPVSSVNQDQVDYVFTLVHGTWAESSLFKVLSTLLGTPMQQWYQPGSKLWQQLQANFPRSRIEPFKWSGRNSAYARAKGAKELTTKQHLLLETYNEAQHFIIAHSHGGNVACYTLRDDIKIREKIVGLICLSTPFLLVQKRDLKPFMKRLLLWTGIMP